uniref:Uncharacterized protein AlNc14C34G3094 n=1 Tax=Albugo laibachii Nc14 TaxID=890382 RepID=F0W8G4_9STRA|nr:conserved hypothetical protein [Albugo laibachii Nc14]|eukprot:CCA17419.1 conserved hypothetical protein [Albugo laibachii Nc14]
MRAAILRFYPNISQVAYKSKRTQIYSWKKAHQKLRAATQANKGGHRKIRYKGTATLLSNDLENEIVRFVNELRNEGVPVLTAMLTIQAKKVAAETAVSPFSASRLLGERVQGSPSDERSSTNTRRAAESSGSR